MQAADTSLKKAAHTGPRLYSRFECHTISQKNHLAMEALKLVYQQFGPSCFAHFI